ncbi:uncharacterized protein B0H18DRAFT_1113815 [Fomitopsis serialis]|uniref:uncharacterized protein n=1 Tax=Fomitopsis serialis TaxID=139415 RepID=UPI0020074293|nr:uncharacterized protein B0H18DRAFT_1113815 [Neoantrodia serialis]KAH9936427.1 hypothetical protein B0H18DRAFT_1113815 [Neoantrodia serialis]
MSLQFYNPRFSHAVTTMTILLQYFTRDELDPAQIQRKCMLIGSELRMCPMDIAAFAAVGFLIYIVLWGIPMTVSLVTWCKAKRTKPLPRRLSLYEPDTEKGHSNEESESLVDDTKYGCDPYLSPTKRLFIFLRSDGALPHPVPACTPRHRSDIASISPRGTMIGSPPQPSSDVKQAANGANPQCATLSRRTFVEETVLMPPPPVYSGRPEGRRTVP